MAAPVIKLKRSSVPGKVPLTSDIDLGEIAINTFDGKAYFKKNNGAESIIEIGTGAGSSNSGSYLAPTLLSLYNKNNAGSLAAFNGTETRFQLRNSSGNNVTVNDALLVAISVDGVIQKPNSGVPAGSFEGFYIIANATVGADIVFSTAPTTGADFFGILGGTFAATSGTTGITKLDNLTSEFNSAQTSFTLKVNGTAYVPEYINALLISLGGVVQVPISSYTISGSTITFTTAPATNVSFYGIDFKIGEIQELLQIDGGSSITIFSGQLNTLIGGNA